MERRIKFKKTGQRKFLNKVKENLNSKSVRGILQYGFNLKYSALKSYYTARRDLPENLFNDLCYIAKIDKTKLNYKIIPGNFGQIKGGKSRSK